MLKMIFLLARRMFIRLLLVLLPLGLFMFLAQAIPLSPLQSLLLLVPVIAFEVWLVIRHLLPVMGELVSKIIRNISLLNREIWKEMLITNSDISSLFDWSKTPEGDMFWRKVYNEHYCGLSKTYTETKIRITKNNKTSINNEDQLQRAKSIVCGGDVPEGDILYGKKSKSSVTSGSLSFRKCLGR